MSPGSHDIRKSFIDKAKRRMDDGRWPELMLAMDAVILSKKGDDINTKRELMLAHRMRAHALSRMTRFSDAVADYQEALEISKALEDKAEEAMCMEGLGRVSWHMGEVELAMDFLKGALSLSLENKDAETEARTRITLAFIDMSEGNLERSMDGFQTAIEILSPVGPSEQLARAHYNLGHVLIKLGRIDEALLFLKVALDVSMKVGNAAAVGFSRTFMAICYARNGETARALELVDLAVRDLGKAHDLVGLVDATSAQGLVHHLAGNDELALQELRQAESLATKNGLETPKSEVLVRKAEILAEMGELLSAKIALTEAIGIQRRVGNKKRVEEMEKRLAELANKK